MNRKTDPWKQLACDAADENALAFGAIKTAFEEDHIIRSVLPHIQQTPHLAIDLLASQRNAARAAEELSRAEIKLLREALKQSLAKKTSHSPAVQTDHAEARGDNDNQR